MVCIISSWASRSIKCITVWIISRWAGRWTSRLNSGGCWAIWLYRGVGMDRVGFWTSCCRSWSAITSHFAFAEGPSLGQAKTGI